MRVRAGTVSGDASRETTTRFANQRHAIRVKSRFWLVTMRREAAEHENFFIAKCRDSESAQHAFDRPWREATTFAARRSFNASITKTPAAQSLPAISSIARIGFARAVRVVACMVCQVVGERSSRALASPRQYFLKRDAVFLDVLVYSGCSASRFPSARSD
jgi:ribosomal protein S27E